MLAVACKNCREQSRVQDEMRLVYRKYGEEEQSLVP